MLDEKDKAWARQDAKAKAEAAEKSRESRKAQEPEPFRIPAGLKSGSYMSPTGEYQVLGPECPTTYVSSGVVGCTIHKDTGCFVCMELEARYAK